MAILEKKWPRTHKILLVLTVLLLIAVIAIYTLVLVPLYDRYDESLAEHDKELSTIKKSEWDSSETGIAHATKLYTLAIGNKKAPAGKQKSDDLLAASTAHLQKLIDDVKTASKNPAITKDGKKTYSDNYDEIKKYLLSKNIELAPTIYGMGRASEGNYYNMTLKLLLTKDVTDLLLKHHLTVTRSAEEVTPEAETLFTDARSAENVKKIHASEISTMPVRAFAQTEDSPIYLLEIPLKVTARGNLADFAAFAADLQKDGRCYSITNIEMQTEKPMLLNARRAQLIPSQEDARKVHLEAITVTFICTGFVHPEIDKMQEEINKRKSEEKRTQEATEAVEKPIGI